MADGERAEDVLDVPLGTVVTSTRDSHRWVVIGWAKNTVGKEIVLVRELQGDARLTGLSPWLYHCSIASTLLARFPDLEKFRK